MGPDVDSSRSWADFKVLGLLVPAPIGPYPGPSSEQGVGLVQRQNLTTSGPL